MNKGLQIIADHDGSEKREQFRRQSTAERRYWEYVDDPKTFSVTLEDMIRDRVLKHWERN